jgi:hypothetical protein
MCGGRQAGDQSSQSARDPILGSLSLEGHHPPLLNSLHRLLSNVSISGNQGTAIEARDLDRLGGKLEGCDVSRVGRPPQCQEGFKP